MAKLIKRVTSGFGIDGLAKLEVPNGAESLALRFLETNEINPDPLRMNPEIKITYMIDSEANAGTHSRIFMLIPDGSPTPPAFKKFVGTFPRGKDKRDTHVIELLVGPPAPALMEGTASRPSEEAVSVEDEVTKSKSRWPTIRPFGSE